MPTAKLPNIKDVTDLAGKRVLLRSALNVPIENGVVINEFRLTRAVETVRYLTEHGAKVILMGHIGREKDDTLEPVYELLKTRLEEPCFSHDVAGADSKVCVDEMKDGAVVMLENVRRDPREMKNDLDFARSLASLADMYVNDAFPDSHREHASIVGIPQFIPSYFGMNFLFEYEELLKGMKPSSPSLFLLGGAKFDTKLPLVDKFLSLYDRIFIGGALANDFFKAKGYEVGESLVSDVDLSDSPLLSEEKIILPVDVVVRGKKGIRETSPDDVAADERIVDVGAQTVATLEPHIREAKTVLWNGPFGDYEHGFGKSTEATAKLVAAATAHSVVGGGDTIAAIAALHLQDKFSFLSTAGGAMLTFLETGTLPGIEAVLVSQKESA